MLMPSEPPVITKFFSVVYRRTHQDPTPANDQDPFVLGRCEWLLGNFKGSIGDHGFLMTLLTLMIMMMRRRT